MRTRSFQSVLHAAAQRGGIEPARLQATHAQALAGYATAAMRYCWQYAPWPEILRVEERATEFGIVAWQQTGERVLGAVLKVYDADPLSETEAREVRWVLGPQGIYLHYEARNLDSVWVSYRPEPPRFTAEPWDSGTDYGAGHLVYHAGECWLATGGTTYRTWRVNLGGAFSAVDGVNNGQWTLYPPNAGDPEDETVPADLPIADYADGQDVMPLLAARFPDYTVTAEAPSTLVFTPKIPTVPGPEWPRAVHDDFAGGVALGLIETPGGSKVLVPVENESVPGAAGSATWLLQPVPAILAEALELMMRADVLEEQDQFTKAAGLRGRGAGYLEEQLFVLRQQEGQEVSYRPLQ